MNDQRIVFGLLLCLIADSNSQDPVPCSDPDQQLMNTVVYEGESTSFSNQPDLTGVKWQIYPSYDPINDFDNLPPFTIADNNVPQSPFIGYYAVNPTQLTIPYASIYNQSSGPYSTSGIYMLTYKDDNCYVMANLIVVSYGPECLCTPATDSDFAQLSCELDYGMASPAQQYATMTWYDESGNQVGGPDTPVAYPADPKYYSSGSALQITSSGAASYTCTVTFTEPATSLDGFATNAPTFNASCTVANCVQKIVSTAATTTTTAVGCPMDLVNIVVNEGDVAEFENLDDGEPVKWHFSSSSDPKNNLLDITDYDNTVNPMFVGAYNVTKTKLTILDATVAPKGNNAYATAGVYFLTYQSTGCQTAANLIVIQRGPVCDRNENDPNDVILSCNISYAESERQPSYPTMTWTTGSVVIQDDNPTTHKYAFVNESLSQLPVDNTVPAYYQCQIIFNAPAPVAYPIPFLAHNVPSYSKSCTVASDTFPPTTEIVTTAEACVDRPICQPRWLSNQTAFCEYVQEFQDDCPAFCNKC